MRTINIDGKDRQIEATPYSLTLHERAFDRDLIEESMTLVNVVQEQKKINGSLLLRIVYTLEKTAKMKYNNNKFFPDYDAWSMELGRLSLHKQEAYIEIVEEIEQQFFRDEEEKEQKE